jgi:hypothetical protein
VARDPGNDRGHRVAEMIERLVAPDAPAENRAAENAKADGGDRGRKDGIGQAGCSLRDHHRPEQGHNRRDRHGDTNNERACSNQGALTNRCIDECAGRPARKHRGDAADRENDADAPRTPLLACHEVDGEKRTGSASDVRRRKLSPSRGPLAAQSSLGHVAFPRRRKRRSCSSVNCRGIAATSRRGSSA